MTKSAKLNASRARRKQLETNKLTLDATTQLKKLLAANNGQDTPDTLAIKRWLHQHGRPYRK